MKCLHCSGTLKKDRTSYTANRHGYHLIIDDLPAWVCQQCGEPMFDEVTVDTIQDVLRELDQRLDRLSQPVAA